MYLNSSKYVRNSDKLNLFNANLYNMYNAYT